MTAKERFVVDTHALVWYLLADPRLSETARGLIQAAEHDQSWVVVPTIVLAEALYLAEKNRLALGLGAILDRLAKMGGFEIAPFDLFVLKGMEALPASLEMHDRIILATARAWGAKLISRDEALRESGLVELAW